MSNLVDLPKRLLIGRAKRSEALAETLLPKRIALPVFASDALSSVSYATQEILLVLSLGGLALYAYTPWIAVGVVLVLLTVVASYRQNVRAYPSGGGDYEVATVNLGRNAGVTVASALLVDYVLTVAVSVSAAVDNITSAVPAWSGAAVPIAVALVLGVTTLNLRGVRESGTAFAIPTYAFLAAILAMFVWAAVRIAGGAQLRAESADYEIVGASEGVGGLALAFLLLRAFSSGCTALTGVEAISNGVPAFRQPKSRNAATTLLLLGVLSITMFSGITFLARYTQVKVADESHGATLANVPPGHQDQTVIAQVADTVFSNFPPGFYAVSLATALILVLAANTAFNGFPVLGSILAEDRYLPRQLHTRGDRLAYSNGILLLAAFACLLIWAFDAEVTQLIQLYIVGVFVSFTLSQLGMVRHWNRHLADEHDPAQRARMRRAQAVNAFGCLLTGVVLVIVLATKFAQGAWIVCIAMPLLFLLMKGIHRHYQRVAQELVVGDDEVALPSRTHAIVLVSKIHKPTLRAVSYARATRPSTLEAVTVNVDAEETAALTEEWERLGIPVPLKVLASPYREITDPVIDYVHGLRRSTPRDVVTVFVPEYVVGHWWENALHNQSALRLKTRLRFSPGVMVTSVPWQLHSSVGREDRGDGIAPGRLRRGERNLRRAGADRAGGAADPRVPERQEELR